MYDFSDASIAEMITDTAEDVVVFTNVHSYSIALLKLINHK